MAEPIVFLDARVFVGGADLSGNGSKIEVMEEAEYKATTNWRSGGAREGLAGLFGSDISAEGQWAAGDVSAPDDAFWRMRRTLDPWSIAPGGDSDLAPGGLMWLLGRALRTKFQQWGDVGDVAPWSGEARSAWPLVRGKCAHASGVPRSGNGSGTALQLGAVSSSQYVYANLHPLSVSGSGASMTVKVQSDDNSGFTTPTDRLTFTSVTAASLGTGQGLRVKGPFTDTYWRVSWTIAGTTPSFLFLASLGIE